MIHYHIISLNVNAANAVVKFEKKLPSHFETCTGYIARVSKGITNPSNLSDVGMIALEFNNKKIHAVNSIVEHQPKVEGKVEYQTLGVTLESNTLFSCVYHDWKNSALVPFTPYEVKVYLRCQSKAKRNV